MIGYAAAAAGRGAGGVRRYVDALGRELAREGERRGIPWRRVGDRAPGAFPLAKYAAVARLASVPLRLLHVPNTYAPWFRTPFPKAVTVYDLTPILVPWGHTRRNVLHHRLMLGRILAVSDLVFAASRATARDLAAFGVASGKVTIAAGGADPAFSGGAPREAGFVGRFLLSVGAHEPRKNLPGLLAAYRCLREWHGVRLPLLVVGPPGWKTRASPPEPGVHWLGFVPDAELRRLYREASCLVYPSFYEGFGLPVLEAMAGGVPVVTSDRGSIPEVGGDAVLYADPADPAEIAAACLRVLTDRGLREVLSRRGRDRARLFSWERTARVTWDAYEEILRDTSPLAPRPSVSEAACA